MHSREKMNSRKTLLSWPSVRRSALWICAAFALASSAAAQNLPFQLQLIQGTSTTTVQNPSVLTFVSAVGGSQSVQLRAVYTGTGQVAINSNPS